MAERVDDSGRRWGFSRREFIKGSGAMAAATALHPNGAVAQQESGAPIVRGPTTVTLNVNGRDQRVTIEPRDTLLDVLRYQLNLTGAKPVALDGSSGAATVLLDGQPAEASTKLAIACQGIKIQTAESLGGATPDAVVESFVAHDAEQCGFCTPGFVVAVRAFLKRNPQATEEQIRAGLNGNICRCGTYANVIQAALAVVKGDENG